MTNKDKIKKIGQAVVQLEGELIAEGKRTQASQLVAAIVGLPFGSMVRLYDIMTSPMVEPTYLWQYKAGAEGVLSFFLDGADEGVGGRVGGNDDDGWYVEITEGDKVRKLTREDF